MQWPVCPYRVGPGERAVTLQLAAVSDRMSRLRRTLAGALAMARRVSFCTRLDSGFEFQLGGEGTEGQKNGIRDFFE